MKKNEVIEEPLIEEVTIDTFLSGIEVTKNYNDNINVHLPQYLNFKPVQKVLVRVYRRLPIITKGGMIIDTPAFSDYAKVMKQAGSGQDYAVNEAPTEFRFTKEAVIVALPEFLKSTPEKPSPYQVGQTVCIEQLPTKANKTSSEVTYYDYLCSFVHPHSNKILTPSDCTDEDYGYALIPVNLIEGIIE